jgi:chromosome segregation ATPase
MPEPRAKPAPKISADPNDVTGYRRPGGRVRGERGGSGLGSNLLLALLVCGLGAAGWFITTQHQQLEKAEGALTQADKRLAVLEERLQVTDQVMSESGTEVQSKLGQWETEIRKLGDASKRDKQMLADDQTKLKEHDGSIEGIQAAIKDLKTSDSRQEQALAQQSAIAQQLASVDQQVKQLVAQQRQLTDQVNAARQSVAGIETGLTKRVVANEKAIEAIDAYRLQLNSRLVDLQTRVDSVAGAKSP